MKIICHSLFGSHLQYGTQLWGQENCVNRNNVQNLQNRTLRKITFKKSQKLEQNQTLAKSFVTLKHCGDNHNYQTRASTKRILDTPLYKTNTWVFVLIQQNIIVLRIETSLKESSLTSQKLTILIENLNH